MANIDFINLKNSYEKRRFELNQEISNIEKNIYRIRERSSEESIKHLEAKIKLLEDTIIKAKPRLPGAEKVECPRCRIYSLAHEQKTDSKGIMHGYLCLMPDCNYHYGESGLERTNNFFNLLN